MEPAGDVRAAGQCKPAATLLTEITAELNRFEAKKLGELKAELEAFVKQQDALVTEYKEKKYAPLREKWCAQHQQIEKLHAAIKCALPDDPWKKILTTCICEKQHAQECLDKRIKKRKRCCDGPLERARNQAHDRFEDAKLRLKTLSSNAQKLEAELAEHDKLIKEIQGLLPGPEQAVVLYLFWLKLLPAHRRMTPDDVTAECKKFGESDAPDKICGRITCDKCKPEPGACTIPDDGCGTDAEGASPGQNPPWLIHPDKYGAALDCAWESYRNAKDAFAEAESKYKGAPDDIESLSKLYDDNAKKLEADIRDCLKKEKPADKCCKQADGQQGQGVANA